MFRTPWSGSPTAAKALAGGVSAVYSFPLRNLDQHVGSIGLFNTTPAELDQMDLELALLLADLTSASIVRAHRYQQVSGLAAGVQQRLADAAVLEQAKGGSALQPEYGPTVPSSICSGTSSPAAAASARRPSRQLPATSDCGGPPPTRSPGIVMAPHQGLEWLSSGLRQAARNTARAKGA